MTIAAQTDFAGLADALKLLIPEKDPQEADQRLAGGIGAVVPIDIFKELLPNIGPDWGVCVLPSRDAKQAPHAIIALAVKPGSKRKAGRSDAGQGGSNSSPDRRSRTQQEQSEHAHSARNRISGQDRGEFPRRREGISARHCPSVCLEGRLSARCQRPGSDRAFQIARDGPGRAQGDAAGARLHARAGPAPGTTPRAHPQQLAAKDAKQHLENVIAALGHVRSS